MHNSFVTARQLLLKIRESMSQPEIELATGIAQSTLSRIESGLIEDPVGSKYVALMKLHERVIAAEAPEGTEGQPIPDAASTAIEPVKVAA